MLDQAAAPIDRVFAALADPTRRAIVDRLAGGPASVSELARPLTISLAAVVQHVQVLEASGLVSSAKEGRVRTCRIEPNGMRAAERWITDRRLMWEERLDRLAEYVDMKQAQEDVHSDVRTRKEDKRPWERQR